MCLNSENILIDAAPPTVSYTAIFNVLICQLTIKKARLLAPLHLPKSTIDCTTLQLMSALTAIS